MEEKTDNIDILEEFINQYNTDEDLFCFVNYNTIQAISNLISENKEVKEENKGLKKKVEELIYRINEDIRRSDLRRTNATRTTAMEEEFKVKYSAEAVKYVLQSLLGKE